jgi:hypothetical protein
MLEAQCAFHIAIAQYAFELSSVRYVNGRWLALLRVEHSLE